jgi:predicted molibdopterin-dependent oxidoreductase YjgC
MHPETAEKYGIVDGDWVWIESPRGRIRQKARVFPGILKGVLMATANCFYPEESPESYHGLFISNPNVLANNNHLDPMYGSPDLTCLLCKVYPCAEEDLQENAKKPEIGNYMDSAMELIEKNDPSLKGVLPKDYSRPALDKARLGEFRPKIAWSVSA